MSELNSPKTSGLTQAQALFAVLAVATQARRDRVYYRDKALRSSLYFIPHRDNSVADANIVEGSLAGSSAYSDTSLATASLSFNLASVRKDYVATDDSMNSVLDFNIAMTYVGIAYPVYTATDDSMNSALNFNIAMTYTEILFPVYTEDNGDSMNSALDFNIAMTKS